jgi:MoaA/NifB/PqqE/SkfB family radical SAM enzyme
MSVNQAYTHTSNVSKLLKHIPKLTRLQKGGSAVPIMVHTMPTHRCQLKCEHCCFRNRTDVQMDIDLKTYMRGVYQFWELGTRAIELTGGGEPVLYPKIGYCLEYFYDLGMSIGLISNGLALPRIKDELEKIAWVRISLNTLDYRHQDELQPSIDLAKDKTHLSTCYIWNKYSIENLPRIFEFTKKNNLVCRVSPDCIQEVEKIDIEMNLIRNELTKLPENNVMFLSDFNTTLIRRNTSCYIHLIKPALYTDGYVYPCPSAELALENNKAINEKFRLCHATEIYDFYRNMSIKKLEHGCSYCKYTKQQELIEDLLMETDFNDFA